MRKELGKISRAEFGWCGYQDAMIGLALTFQGEAWGCTHSDCAWGTKRSEYTKWTEEDRIRELGEISLRIRDLLKDAKVQSVSELVGKPVECTFDGTILKEFRILTEVL